MAKIDVGSIPVYSTSQWGGTRTLIDYSNPAEKDGKITSVEIYTGDNSITGLKVAIFKDNGGGSFTATNVVTIGNVASGAKRTFDVDLDILIGEYIGCYFPTGDISVPSTGGNGIYYTENGNDKTETTATYSFGPSYYLSLYGSGETVEVGGDFLQMF